MNNIDESFEDIETLLKKQRSSKTTHILESSATYLKFFSCQIKSWT